MFNLCLLQRGRKESCIDKVDMARKQIANLQSQIAVMEKHNVAEDLTSKMKHMKSLLERFIAKAITLQNISSSFPTSIPTAKNPKWPSK